MVLNGKGAVARYVFRTTWEGMTPLRNIAVRLWVLMLLFGSVDSESHADDLGQLASEGNEAATQAVRSYYCKVHYEISSHGTKGAISSEYWRDNPLSFRIREATTPTTTTDVLGAEGKVRIFRSDSTKPRNLASASLMIDEINRKTLDTDAWQLRACAEITFTISCCVSA